MLDVEPLHTAVYFVDKHILHPLGFFLRNITQLNFKTVAEDALNWLIPTLLESLIGSSQCHAR